MAEIVFLPVGKKIPEMGIELGRHRAALEWTAEGGCPHMTTNSRFLAMRLLGMTNLLTASAPGNLFELRSNGQPLRLRSGQAWAAVPHMIANSRFLAMRLLGVTNLLTASAPGNRFELRSNGQPLRLQLRAGLGGCPHMTTNSRFLAIRPLGMTNLNDKSRGNYGNSRVTNLADFAPVLVMVWE